MIEPRIRIENVLRDYAEMNPETFYRSRCEKEAADEIQSLRQRVERLEGEIRSLRDERKTIVQNPRVNDAIQTAFERGELSITMDGYLDPLSPKVQEGE